MKIALAYAMAAEIESLLTATGAKLLETVPRRTVLRDREGHHRLRRRRGKSERRHGGAAVH